MAIAWCLSLALLFAADDLEAKVDQLRANTEAQVDEAEQSPLTNGRHYYASNERDLHLFATDVEDRGGLMLAVAADPGYILAAWANADALIFVDLDPAIVDLHRIYAAFFRAADDSEDFRHLWNHEGIARAEELITSAAEETGDAARLLAIYSEARPAIARRFADLTHRFAQRKVPWLLSDEALYRRVTKLVRSERVLALRGDLTRSGQVSLLGRELDNSDLEISLLYLSNAEQYFMYKEAFRTNMLTLPLAEQSLVLRPLPGRPAGFEYIVQDGADFQARVGDPRVRSVYRIRGLKRGQHLVGRTHYVVPSKLAPAPRVR